MPSGASPKAAATQWVATKSADVRVVSGDKAQCVLPTLSWLALSVTLLTLTVSKITVSCHLTPVRVVAIDTSNHKCWRGCGGKGALAHYW